MIHESPIDKLIAKNQQKMKKNTNNKSVKKPYLSRQENVDKQYKSMKTCGEDNTSETPKILPPRNKKKNWSEQFQERRRSRRLSQLPPIENIKKEIVNEEFCESYDEKSYNIITEDIKEEKTIKTEIEDCISDDTYPYGLKVEDNSDLALNISSDPNDLSNHYPPQNVEIREENNDNFESTTNGSLNIFTYSENNYAPMRNITDDWNLVVNQEMNPKTTDNEQTSSDLIISQVWCSEIPNNEQTNLNLADERVSSPEYYDDKETNLNVVLKRELAEEKALAKMNLNMNDEYFLDSSDNELDTNDYTYDNTNIYDTEIEESESFVPKILECWSFQNNEKQIYSEMNQIEIEEDKNKSCENTVLEKSLPVINSDLEANKAAQSQYKNSSGTTEIIESSSQLIPELQPPIVVKKPGRPKTNTRKNKTVVYKHILPKTTETTTNTNTLFQPMLTNLQPCSIIFNPTLQQKEPNKTIEEPVLLDNNFVENLNSVPILQRNYSDLIIADKILYREKLTYITALGLISIHLYKKNKQTEVSLKTNFFSSKIPPIDDGNYTDRKYFRTSSDKIRRSYLLEYSNNEKDSKQISGPILIPEKSVGSSFHPGRACMNKCSICHGIYGTLDTPCHLAQIKNLDKQKVCLEKAPYLVGPSSCLCETCFNRIQKKCVKPSLPKNVCMIMGCNLIYTKQYNTDMIEKVKTMIFKRGASIRSSDTAVNAIQTCQAHYEEILKITECQLCGNRTPHKILVERTEIKDFQIIIDRIKVPHILDRDFFICKACHVYLLWTSHLMTSTMNRPTNIRKHCNDVLKRICLYHNVDYYVNRNKGKEPNTKKKTEKVISDKPNTTNKVHGNNIKDTEEHIFKIPAPVPLTKSNTANSIKNSDRITLKIPTQVPLTKPCTVNKIQETYIKDPKTNVYKRQPTSTITSAANKIPTMDSLKLNTNINDNNSNNCQTINLPVCSQPTRSVTNFVSEVKEQKEPLTTQPNIKLVHQKEQVMTDKPMPQYNLKQILHPPSTVSNNKATSKLPMYVPVLKPADISKLPPFKSNMTMSTLKLRTVEDNLLLPKVPELKDFYIEEEESINVKVSANVFKIFQELQKPYTNSTELFNQLLMIENYRMQGDLVQNDKSNSSLPLKPMSTTKNQVASKSMYNFPQIKNKLISEGNKHNPVAAKPLSTNTITQMKVMDNDGRVIKKPKIMNGPLNSKSKVQIKPPLQIPSRPIKIAPTPSNKFISIPLSVVANGVICKPLEMYNNSLPNNQNVSPCKTTMNSCDAPKLILASTVHANKNVTIAAKCVKVTSFKNVPMKRVYPMSAKNNNATLQTVPCFKTIPPKTLKNLRVIRTTKQLTPEELRMARANASANATALLKMGFMPKT